MSFVITMLTIKTSDLSPVEIQGYLNVAIAPRPVCFATTIDKEGQSQPKPI
ncbi:MAG: hypothetical protein ACHQIM_02235 [Sphingobacteriales bacterium]